MLFLKGETAQEEGGGGATLKDEYKMIINDICKQYEDTHWFEEAISDFVNDCPEKFRSKAPKSLMEKGPYDMIDWLVHRCEPPYTLEEIADYLIDCQTP